MDISYYFTTAKFTADNPDLPQDDVHKKKFFDAGTLVIGSEQNIGQTRVIKSQDGYELPEAYVRLVEDQQAIKSLQDMQYNINRIVNRDMVSDMIKANEYSIAGSSFGAVAGILFGIISKKNIFWCGVFGTIGGAAIGYGVAKVGKKLSKV